jgi:antitoxin VapB
MGLNIKNSVVEQLAAEVANLAGETKTEAIRRALLERRARLRAQGKRSKSAGLREYLERNVWPLIPQDELGRVLTREQEDQILGYGPEGY